MSARRPVIGLFGGTFDPFHEGHLAFARQAKARLSLDRVVFIPNAQNPLKTEAAGASGAHRLAMIECGLKEAGERGFEACDIEVRRPGPSFTIDTVEALQKQIPEADWILLMGSEVFSGLARWKNPRALLDKVRVAVVTRPGESAPDIARVVHEIAPSSLRGVHALEIPALPFSATSVREQLGGLSDAARAALSSPLPGLQRSVWRYIKENRLYSVG